MSNCAFWTLDLVLAEPAFENRAESIYSLECPAFLKKIVFCGSEGKLRTRCSAASTPHWCPSLVMLSRAYVTWTSPMLYILDLMLKYAILFADAWKTVTNNVELWNQSLNIMVQFQGQSFWPYWADMQTSKKGRSHKAIISIYIKVPGLNILISVVSQLLISYLSSIVINLTKSIHEANKSAGFCCAEYT